MALIYTTPSDFWIKSSALNFTLNVLGNPDCLQVSVLSGAVIIVHKAGIIDYDASHSYRKWNLEAHNTLFDSTAAKYVYARIPRDESQNKALIVFPNDRLDLYGKKNDEDEPSSDFFYIYLGKISASVNEQGDVKPREWEDPYNSGILATDQYLKEEPKNFLERMFRLNEVTGLIEVLKTFSQAAFNVITVVNKLIFGEKVVSGVKRSVDSDDDYPISDESLATSKFVSDGFLSKVSPSTAKEVITFLKGFSASGKSTLSEAEIVKIVGVSAYIQALESVQERTLNLVVQALAEVHNLTVNQTADIMQGIIRRYVSSDTFVSGMLGSGFKVWKDDNGDWCGELDKLTVRKLFYVFELVYQKAIHQGGMVIRSAAGGQITAITDEVDHWRCEHNGTDTFEVDDLVFCQTFRGLESKRYWRRALSAGAGFVCLSKTDCESNSGIPAVGDDICLKGNKTNPARQSLQIDCAVGINAPYRADYTGVNDYTLEGRCTYLTGNLSGIVDPVFGTLSGTGLYSSNAYLRGIFRLSSGKTVEEHTGAEIEKIRVGGRNYIRNSDSVFTDSGSLPLTKSIQQLKGKSYVLSFEYEYSDVNTGEFSRFGVETGVKLLSGGYDYSLSLFIGLPDSSTGLRGKGRAVKKLTLPLDIEGDYTELGIYKQRISGNVRMWNFKLGEGNVLDDWSPAPEDATAAFDSIRTDFDIREGQISAKVQEVTAKAKAADNAALLAMAVARGKMLYRDPMFAEGQNNTHPYNFFNVQMSLSVVSDAPGNPNTTGKALKLSVQRNTAGAYWYGGFYFETLSRANAVFVTRIVAKIPVGRILDFGSNQTGDGSQYFWLTSQEGTGEWEEYAHCVKCGATGNFSSTCFFPIVGGENVPFDWFVAYATVFDVTGMEEDFALKAEQAANRAVASEAAINLKADGVVIEAAKRAVSGLQLGGRNYFKNTSPVAAWTDSGVEQNTVERVNTGFNFTGNRDHLSNVRIGEVITENGWWTVSFDVQSNGSSHHTFTVDICDTGEQTFNLHETPWTFKHIELSVYVENHSDIYNFVDIGRITWLHFNVRNLKVEKGNKATDYSPAPEDYSTTEEIRSSISVTPNKINLVGKEIDLTGKVTIGAFDQTVIDGGKLKNDLINTDLLIAKRVQSGVNPSAPGGYNAVIDENGNGHLCGGKIKFKNGESEFEGNLKGVSGSFKELVCTNTQGQQVGGIRFDGTTIRLWGDIVQYLTKSGDQLASFSVGNFISRGTFAHTKLNILTYSSSQGTDVYFQVGTEEFGLTNLALENKNSVNSKDPVDLIMLRGNGEYAIAICGGAVGKTVIVANDSDVMKHVMVNPNGSRIKVPAWRSVLLILCRLTTIYPRLRYGYVGQPATVAVTFNDAIPPTGVESWQL